ncbi:dTDP-glucose 4,6-dehydratase [Streptomyces sp. NPDC050560]|uniref:dTDP-glucose 4,6-dehydratase n=1 Tax=Streptomyces sp. NPDC050560 TaxID=3365630 RepID=UPI0037A51ADA
MRVLVTGGAGFIGAHYTRGLLNGEYPGSEGAEVTVLDKLTYAGNLANLPVGHPRLRFVHGDITDRELLERELPGHDAVVHFAAESHVDRSITGASAFVETNIVGTQCLADVCVSAGVSPFVYVSTDEVYGSIPHGAWDESCPLAPNSPYAASKAGGELMARAYWRTHGLDVRITRCSNNYGPYQHVEKLIPLFVTHLLSGRPVPLYGDGGNVREWMHVRDHCAAVHLVTVAGKAGDVYNIGGDTALSNREVTERIIRLCDADWSQVRYVPDRRGHDRRYALDASRIREELGFVPRIGFDEGLAEVVRWYRDNPAWWKPLENAPASG